MKLGEKRERERVKKQGWQRGRGVVCVIEHRQRKEEKVQHKSQK